MKSGAADRQGLVGPAAGRGRPSASRTRAASASTTIPQSATLSSVRSLRRAFLRVGRNRSWGMKAENSPAMFEKQVASWLPSVCSGWNVPRACIQTESQLAATKATVTREEDRRPAGERRGQGERAGDRQELDGEPLGALLVAEHARRVADPLAAGSARASRGENPASGGGGPSSRRPTGGAADRARGGSRPRARTRGPRERRPTSSRGRASAGRCGCPRSPSSSRIRRRCRSPAGGDGAGPDEEGGVVAVLGRLDAFVEHVVRAPPARRVRKRKESLW